MSTFENMKLYIARVEVYHPKNFVASTFQSIGKVSKIDYITKYDFSGNEYNSAIVSFSCWILSDDALNLFREMSSTNNAKFYYKDKKGYVKYWIVKEYNEEVTMQYINAQTIEESQACQLTYYRMRNAEVEKQLTEMNSTAITQRLQIDYLNHKLDDADICREILKMREMDLNCIIEENRKLREELELLKRDVKDRDRMIEYYEKEQV